MNDFLSVTAGLIGLFIGFCTFVLIYRLFWKLSPKWYNGKDPKKQLSRVGLLANRIIVGGLAAILGAKLTAGISIAIFHTLVTPDNENLPLERIDNPADNKNPPKRPELLSSEIEIIPKRIPQSEIPAAEINNEDEKDLKGAQSQFLTDDEVSSMEDKVQYHGDDPIIRKRLGLPIKE